MPLWAEQEFAGSVPRSCGARTKARHAQLSVGTAQNEQPNCVLTVSAPDKGLAKADLYQMAFMRSLRSISSISEMAE
jgi:hypothetical protein